MVTCTWNLSMPMVDVRPGHACPKYNQAETTKETLPPQGGGQELTPDSCSLTFKHGMTHVTTLTSDTYIYFCNQNTAQPRALGSFYRGVSLPDFVPSQGCTVSHELNKLLLKAPAFQCISVPWDQNQN